MGIFRDIGAPGVIILILGALLIFGPKRPPSNLLCSNKVSCLSSRLTESKGVAGKFW